MRKKEKKSTKKTKGSEEGKDTQRLERMSKLDVMQKIDELKSFQESNIVEGNNEKAITRENFVLFGIKLGFLHLDLPQVYIDMPFVQIIKNI
ncbi:hypothetical protein ES703_41783 [subsurface metagenome]